MSPRQSSSGIMLLSMLYAIVRYNIASDVAWSQLPLLIVNKATAISGLILLGLAGLQRVRANRNQMGLHASGCLGLHCLLSLMLLSPAQFETLYQNETHLLTWQGSLAMLCGALGIIGQIILWRRSMVVQQGNQRSLVSGLGRGLLLLAAMHVALIGYSNWNQWQSWPATLPPITLIGCLTAVGLAVANHLRKRTPVTFDNTADD